MDITKLERRLKRLTDRKDEMELRHHGNEQNYTYHGGFDLGYLKGKIDEIQNTIDELEEEIIKERHS